MRYILADKEKAVGHGFNMYAHRTVKGLVVLNEKEVMDCPSLAGDLQERSGSVGGTIHQENELLMEISQGGLGHGG